jgi:hypothetical protein
MKRINLITSRNFLYRDTLFGRGYAVTEYGFPPAPGLAAEIQRAAAGDSTFIEANNASIVDHAELYRVIGLRERAILCAEDLSRDSRRFLLECGISDLLASHDDEKLVAVLKTAAAVSELNTGTFVVLEHGTAVRKVLKSIIGRFSYRVVFVSSVEELFDTTLDGGVQFVLINIGSAGLDLSGLVRKSYSRELARTVPVLAYKDMREGLFVHELVGGLNRLTKYILSLEELYGIIVEVLYRKELVPLVARLRKLADCEANACFDADSLSRAYFACEKTIFTQTSLLTDATFDGTSEVGQCIQSVIMKVESLKWLKLEIDRRCISTAGGVG